MKNYLVIRLKGATGGGRYVDIKFDCGDSGTSSDTFFNVAGRDWNAFLSENQGTIDFTYNHDEKMMIPGIFRFDVIDFDETLNSYIFLHLCPDTLPDAYTTPSSQGAEVTLYNSDGSVRFRGGLLLEQSGYKLSDMTLSITAAPSAEKLKTIDVRNITFTDTSVRGVLFKLFSQVNPDITIDDITVDCHMIFKAQKLWWSGHNQYGTWYDDCAFDQIRIDPAKLCKDDYSAYSLLRELCMSFICKLFFTSNSVYFGSFLNTLPGRTFDVKHIGTSFELKSDFVKWSGVHISNKMLNPSGNIPQPDNSYSCGEWNATDGFPVGTTGFDYAIGLNKYYHVEHDPDYPHSVTATIDYYYGIMCYIPSTGETVNVYRMKEIWYSSSYVDVIELIANFWYRYKALNETASVVAEIGVDGVDYSPGDVLIRNSINFSTVGMSVDLSKDETVCEGIFV